MSIWTRYEKETNIARENRAGEPCRGDEIDQANSISNRNGSFDS